MKRDFIIPNDEGGYSIMYKGIHIGDANTIKAARNQLAKFKRSTAQTDLLCKFTKMVKDWNKRG